MDGGRDHTLAIFRATAAVLFAAWMLLVVTLSDYCGEIARRIEFASHRQGELAP